jgi:hypothetical protein
MEDISMAKKKWTILVWMAGDNNLEDAGTGDLKEMKQVGSGADLDVLVQFDRQSSDQTVRYHVQHGTTLDQDAVENLGETNTGDPAQAVDFFRWGVRTCPAEHYAVIFWNHGSGIDEEDIYRRFREAGVTAGRKVRRGSNTVPEREVQRIVNKRWRRSLFSTTIQAAAVDAAKAGNRRRAIAYDDTNRDFLDNAELKKVLVAVKDEIGAKIDVVGMDACLMSGMEIAYQLQDTANFMIGSEEVEPGDGWPYDKLLDAIARKPAITAAQLGTALVKAYVQFYSSDAVTQSCLDLSKAESAAKAVDALAAALITSIKKPAEFMVFTKAVKSAQRFDMKDYLDLYDLCRLLNLRSGVAAVKNAAKQVMTALTGSLVVAEGHKGAAVANSKGVTIYFPFANDVTVAYDKLDFAKATRWGDLIEKYQAS